MISLKDGDRHFDIHRMQHRSLEIYDSFKLFMVCERILLL